VKNKAFELVGPDYKPMEQAAMPAAGGRLKRLRGVPLIAIGLLAVIVLGCVFCEAVMNHDPTYMDLANRAVPPDGQFYFGTDMMGRDIFSMIWYGGRISLFIGLAAAGLSTLIAVVYGSISGLSSEWVDDGMMRLTETILSIPSILIVIFIQAIIGQTGPLTIAFVIGITSWMNISKIVRSEVRQIRNADCKNNGRRLLLYFEAASAAKLCIVHYVHGRHKYRRGHRDRGNAELSGHRAPR